MHKSARLEQVFTTCVTVEDGGSGLRRHRAISRPARKEQSRPQGVFGAERVGISTTGGYNLEGYGSELVMPKGVSDRGGEPGQWKPAKAEGSGSKSNTAADWRKLHGPPPTPG